MTRNQAALLEAALTKRNSRRKNEWRNIMWIMIKLIIKFLSLFKHERPLFVSDLANVFLHAVTTCPCRSVIHQMGEKRMTLVASIFATFTNPICTTSLAREVVKSRIWIFIIKKSHAFQGFIRCEFNNFFSKQCECGASHYIKWGEWLIHVFNSDILRQRTALRHFNILSPFNLLLWLFLI